MHPLTTDFAEQILALVRIEAYSLLGAIQDGKTVLGGTAGSGGGTGEPPAGFVGQLIQSKVTFDTAGSSRACSAGSAGSSSLVDNLDAIRLGLEICDDAIQERHIDWGTGAGQVSAVDVPFATTSGSISATNVRDAIEETYAESGGGVGAHSLLSASHPDTTPAAVQQGDLITGGGAWARLPKGTAHQLLKMNAGATAPAWASFDWDDVAAGAAADMVHTHSAAGEGGTHWGGITQTFGGGSAANVITVPDNMAQAMNLKDAGNLEFMRVVSTNANPYLCLFPSGGGKIAVGTATAPHGGIGAALFALDGANASAAGPHVQFTTATDDYPLLQLLNYQHDLIYLNFDAYWDGAWKSSDAGSNCSLVKSNDQFRILYDSGVAQGAAVTWNDALIVDLITGYVGIAIAPTTPMHILSSAASLLRAEGASTIYTALTVANTHADAQGPSIGWSAMMVTRKTGGYGTDPGNFAIRQHLAASNVYRFIIDGSGNVGAGTPTPNARIESLATTEQLRLSYDANSYCSFTVASDSDLTIKPAETGQVKIQPTTDSLTFFQVLDADGGTPVLNVDTTNERVGISQPSPGGKLQVNQGDASGAIPTLVLTQSDVSEEFVRLFGTAAAANLTRSIVDYGDEASSTAAVWVKIYVVDYGEQVTDQAYYILGYTLA